MRVKRNLPDRMSGRRIERLADTLAALSEWSGRTVAWLVPTLVLVTCCDVAMRYLFQHGSILLQELEWHLFSLTFLLGSAYTLRHDDHVRLDLLYRSRWLGDRYRDWVNLLGGLFFLTPFCLLAIFGSWSFVAQSFLHGEGSPDPGGLPYRWILKAAIPAGFALLLLQGIADVLYRLRRILERR